MVDPRDTITTIVGKMLTGQTVTDHEISELGVAFQSLRDYTHRLEERSSRLLCDVMALQDFYIKEGDEEFGQDNYIHDEFECPSCNCVPGDGVTSWCWHPVGCGYSKELGAGES